MKYCFDLDETICVTTSSRRYEEAVPYTKIIQLVNQLFDDGHEISIFTARGGTSGIDYHDLNLKQLLQWGVKYHKLIDQNKPDYDVFIDDKAVNATAWRIQQSITIVGFVASCFDLLHSGHCLLLRDAKSTCDYLIAALQEDPTIDRPHKNKPIQSLAERKLQLESVKYVDEIIIYQTERDLNSVLSRIKPDVRILGSDAKGKPITGHEYCSAIYYHDRNHTYSSSELKQRIKNDSFGY